MKPNLFFYYNHKAEDFFSNSLAYILNLFPQDIGQKFVQRIAVMAGKRPAYFGEFIECEFVAQEFQPGHAGSKPDLKIRCSRRIIHVENKLKSPIRIDQMQRHAELAASDANARLILISNIQLERPDLKDLPGYLYPKGASHYCWADFQSVFVSRARQNSLADKVIHDFKAALKRNWMIERRLPGAKGSIYDKHSEASHLALEQLREVMQEIGFIALKRRRHESTIRAYPVKYGQYPLLNPRYEPSVAWLDENWDKECLVFWVWSKRPVLNRKLKTFHSTNQCSFFPDQYENYEGYYLHGYFVLPLQFEGKGTIKGINFKALRHPLMKMLEFLKGCRA